VTSTGSTGADAETTYREAIRVMRDPTSEASYHVLVGPSEVCQLVRDTDIAWGASELNRAHLVIGLSEPPDAYVMAHCDGGYTTNLPVADLVAGKAMIATRYEGLPLAPAHGGPARLLVPHLYFWKSAKWLRRLRFMPEDEPGFWESRGYHNYGDPWRERRYDGD